MKSWYVFGLFGLGIFLAMGVIYLRSLTYKVGYEVAELKKTQDSLQKKQQTLKSNLEKSGRDIKVDLLQEHDQDGKKVFILPDSHQVLRVDTTESI